MPALPSSVWNRWGSRLPCTGRQLEQLAVDSCITKAPCGGQGLNRSLVTEAGGISFTEPPPMTAYRRRP